MLVEEEMESEADEEEESNKIINSQSIVILL